jgi:hypothetical protein
MACPFNFTLLSDYFFLVLFLAVVFFAAFVAFFCAIPGTPFISVC